MRTIARGPVVMLAGRTLLVAALSLPLVSCDDGHVQAVPNPIDFGARLVGSRNELDGWLVVNPTITVSGPGVIAGHDAANFRVLRAPPTGKLDQVGQHKIWFEFKPDRRGVFHATYTTPATGGTVDEISLMGLGAHDVEIGLQHEDALPDGLDFKPVCFGQSRELTFTVVNRSTSDEDVVLYWNPFNVSFRATPAPGEVRTIARSGGTQSWTIRYTPKSISAVDSAGLNVYRQYTGDVRTGVKLKGEGKKCRDGE